MNGESKTKPALEFETDASFSDLLTPDYFVSVDLEGRERQRKVRLFSRFNYDEVHISLASFDRIVNWWLRQTGRVAIEIVRNRRRQ